MPIDRARWIHLRFWGERDRLRITIHDNGPGIAAEHLPHLFDPFFTTQELGRGVGLGLAIAYTIVQQHGGSIWAENDEDGGAIFSISLPTMHQNPEGPLYHSKRP
jgi:two-component system sensor histidine kinase HupT/HoxJ